jgi:hypothetical protein
MAERFSGQVDVLDSAFTSIKITLDGDNADISSGGNGQAGDLILKDSAGNERIRINGDAGNVVITNAAGDEIIRLNGRHGNIMLGGRDHDGDVIIKSSGDVVTIRQSGDRPRIVMNNPDDSVETIVLDGMHGNIFLGGRDHDGDVIVRNGDVEDTIRLNGDAGTVSLSGHFLFTAELASDERLPGWSTDEGGAEAAFQGSRRAGLVDFTVDGVRDLRGVWIFNPELTDDSVIFLTVHRGNPCGYCVEEMTRPHSISGGVGKFIQVSFIERVHVGDRVRIKYYIMN